MSGFSAKAKLVTSRSSLRGVRGDGVQKIWHQFHQMRPNVGICWIRCNTFASFCSLGLASVLTLRMTNSAALDLFTSKTSLPSHAWLRNAVLRHPFCLFQSKQNYFKPKVNLMSKKSKNFVCVCPFQLALFPLPLGFCKWPYRHWGWYYKSCSVCHFGRTPALHPQKEEAIRGMQKSSAKWGKNGIFEASLVKNQLWPHPECSF